MSLEEALIRNATAVETNNSLLEKLLAKSAAVAGAASNAGAATGADEGKKTTGTRGANKDKAKTVTVEEIKPDVLAWLGEFPKNGTEDHPETTARKLAFKDFLTGVSAGKLTDVKPEDAPKLQAFMVEQKAKGRLAPDAADEGGGDDDMLG